MSERRAIDELLDLHVLGLLDDDGARELRERLASGEGAAELERAADDAVALELVRPRGTPRSEVRARLLAAAAATAQHAAGDAEWSGVGVPGIEVQRLAEDPDGAVTLLVRMAAGASDPGHRHGGFEESVVLTGDLTIGEDVYGPGDYFSCAKGSIHAVQTTHAGCRVVVKTYLHDELLS